MIFNKDVLDYIVIARDNGTVLTELEEDLGISLEVISRLYIYQRSINDGSMRVISGSKDPSHGSVTLEMLKSGWSDQSRVKFFENKETRCRPRVSNSKYSLQASMA